MAKFDLTNLNISKTFQNIVQITGSSPNMFDLTGNPINQLVMTGSLVLGNSENKTAFLQIDNYTSLEKTENRLHARAGFLYWGETRLAGSASITGITEIVEDNTPQLGGNLDVNTNDVVGTGNIGLNGSASFNEISSSKVTADEVTVNKSFLVKPSEILDTYFSVQSGSLESIKVNKDGVFVLGGFDYEVTAESGGMIYRKDNDEFYLGKN